MVQMSATDTRPASPFRSVRPRISNYATSPIHEGFTWSRCASRLEAGEWYLVVFRSVRREMGEHLTLEMHDYGAYIEAQRRASGLLTYFRGTANERGECLSFCVWSSREEAQRAARLPLHAQAMHMADDLYESYSLERYRVRKQPGSARLEFELITTP
jgi:hypothetical protein